MQRRHHLKCCLLAPNWLGPALHVNHSYTFCKRIQIKVQHFVTSSYLVPLFILTCLNQIFLLGAFVLLTIRTDAVGAQETRGTRTDSSGGICTILNVTYRKTIIKNKIQSRHDGLKFQLKSMSKPKVTVLACLTGLTAVKEVVFICVIPLRARVTDRLIWLRAKLCHVSTFQVKNK